jgi:two-component system NtrC family sensor kinase
VQRETERCTAIVRNLLEFARERPIKTGPVDLRAVIDEALTLLGNEARLRNITIEKDFSSFRLVHGDAGQLRQAAMNILINACDAMPGGGVLRIRTVPDEAKHLLDLQVQDTGCGISPENLQKVLDPFFTTKEKGTGLGLSVVYGIVERHGGSVQIQSAVGQGTTVHLRLPFGEQRPHEGSGEARPAVSRTVQGVS